MARHLLPSELQRQEQRNIPSAKREKRNQAWLCWCADWQLLPGLSIRETKTASKSALPVKAHILSGGGGCVAAQDTVVTQRQINSVFPYLPVFQGKMEIQILRSSPNF